MPLGIMYPHHMAKIGAAAGFEVLLHDHDLLAAVGRLCRCRQAGCAAADHQNVAGKLHLFVGNGSFGGFFHVINRRIMTVLGTGATGNALVRIDLVFGKVHADGPCGTVQFAGMTSGADVLINMKRHLYSPFPFIANSLYTAYITVPNADCAVNNACHAYRHLASAIQL